MSVKLLTEHHLEFLSLKGGCTGSSESTLGQNATSLENIYHGSTVFGIKTLRQICNAQTNLRIKTHRAYAACTPIEGLAPCVESHWAALYARRMMYVLELYRLEHQIAFYVQGLH